MNQSSRGPKNNPQLKDSRKTPIDPRDFAEVFGAMTPGVVHFIPLDQRSKILPSDDPDSPHRETVAIAASGLSPRLFATEQIVRATKKGGGEVFKVYRCEFTGAADGQVFRRERTHKFASPECGQVNDHYQNEDTLRNRLIMWPGFKDHL